MGRISLRSHPLLTALRSASLKGVFEILSQHCGGRSLQTDPEPAVGCKPSSAPQKGSFVPGPMGASSAVVLAFTDTHFNQWDPHLFIHGQEATKLREIPE